MPKCLLVLLFIMPMAALAAEPACFTGVWQLDARESDNADRLLKKLQRKQKQQEHIRSRPVVGVDDNSHDLSLPDMIPAFVFNDSPVEIRLDAAAVVIRQQPLLRRLDMSGQTSAVSLSSLRQQGDAVVSGWDQGKLVIETTTLKGSRILELFSLSEAGILEVSIDISHELEEKPVHLEKVYRRSTSTAPECRILPVS